MNTIPSSLSKEEILKKHYDKTGLYMSTQDLFENAVYPAMEEYAAQQLQPPGTSDAGIIKGEFLTELFEAGLIDPCYVDRAIGLIQTKQP